MDARQVGAPGEQPVDRRGEAILARVARPRVDARSQCRHGQRLRRGERRHPRGALALIAGIGERACGQRRAACLREHAVCLAARPARRATRALRRWWAAARRSTGSGCDRRRQAARLMRYEHEERAGRRLLERLQQRVRGGRVHPLGRIDRRRPWRRRGGSSAPPSASARGCDRRRSIRPVSPRRRSTSTGSTTRRSGCWPAARIPAAGQAPHGSAAVARRFAEERARKHVRERRACRCRRRPVISSACGQRSRRARSSVSVARCQWQRGDGAASWASVVRVATASSAHGCTPAHSASTSSSQVRAHVGERTRRVDDAKPSRIGAAARRGSVAHAIEECRRLALELVERASARGHPVEPLARHGAGTSNSSVRSGLQSAWSVRSSAADQLERHAVPAALVGVGRIGEAIADHAVAAASAGSNHLARHARAAPRTSAAPRFRAPSTGAAGARAAPRQAACRPGSRVATTRGLAPPAPRRATRHACSCRRRRCLRA